MVSRSNRAPDLAMYHDDASPVASYLSSLTTLDRAERVASPLGLPTWEITGDWRLATIGPGRAELQLIKSGTHQ